MMLDLKKFFEEKSVPYRQWEIEHNGMTHFIDSEYVIENILETQGMERHKIAGMLFKLDFTNSSIEDYLYFLAKNMIENTF